MRCSIPCCKSARREGWAHAVCKELERYICISMKRVSSVFAKSGNLFYASFVCQLLLTVGLFLSHGSSPGGGLYVGKSTTMYFGRLTAPLPFGPTE